MTVTGLAARLTMLVGTAGAYSLTRFRYPGREPIATLVPRFLS